MKAKRPRQSAKPSRTAKRPSSTGATEPGSTTENRKGLSPEVWEAIGKVLPGIIKAVAQLIEAISRLH
jgi:hypothetical protein